MNFARPSMVGLALLLPGLLAIFVALYANRRRRVADALGESDLVSRLGGGELRRFPARRLLLMMLAGAALGIAAAGPRWGREIRNGQAQALSVVLALDISKSMLARDVAPSRLEQQRLFVRRMLREMPSDRFGLVVFAGRAYVLSPVTVDHSALELYMDALAPDIVSQGGSSLAAAIALATDLARGNQETTTERAVVLVSDGEALEDDDAIEDALDRAVRAGVHVYTVGTGTAAGAPVPDIDPRSGAEGGFKRDENGNTVISKLDADRLTHIAERTGGSFVDLSRAGAADQLARALGKLDRTTETTEQHVELKERYALFVLIALLCIVLDALFAAAPLRPAARVAGGAPAAAASGALAAGGGAPAAPGARRRITQVALLLVVIASFGFGIGDIERGNRLYAEGKYAEAVAAYQKALQSGRATPTLNYNLGTALVQLGRYDEAAQFLNRAIEGVEPDVRKRALYNLGNRFLLQARASKDASPEAVGTMLDAAAEAYRRALRLDPSDADAKWNLELTLRDREENQKKQDQQSNNDEQEPEQQDQNQEQGGGTSTSQSQSESGEGGDAGKRQQQQLSKEQADRILSAVEQDERELTRDKLRKGQRRTPVLRDW